MTNPLTETRLALELLQKAYGQIQSHEFEEEGNANLQRAREHVEEAIEALRVRRAAGPVLLNKTGRKRARL